MKIEIDTSLCEGNAICSALAPGVFEIDDDDLAAVVGDPAEEATAVQGAIDACPRVAIRRVS